MNKNLEAAPAPLPISSEVRFYTVLDLMEMTGWSTKVVLKLFNDPSFPSSDLGKAKIIEAHALIDYFSVRRVRKNEPEDEDNDKERIRKDEIRNELARRLRTKC